MTWWIRPILIALVIMLGWMGGLPSMALAVPVDAHPREISGETSLVQSVDDDNRAAFQIVPELTNPPEMPVTEVQPDVWSPLDWLSGAIPGGQSYPAKGNDIDHVMDDRGDVGIHDDRDDWVDATLEQWLSSVKALFEAQ